MAPYTGKRRRADEKDKGKKTRKVKNFKKQKHYHSSSESDDDDAAPAQVSSDFAPVTMADSDDDVSKTKPVKVVQTKKAVTLQEPASADNESREEVPDLAATGLDAAEDEDEEDVGISEAQSDDEGPDESEDVDDDEVDEFDVGSEASSDADEEAGTVGERKQRKRNDPSAFANSMSKILSSKLSTSKRADPVLSRSAAASAVSRELTDARLEAKAKRKLHAAEKQALERGRVRDVLGLEDTDVSTAQIQEQEKRLKKTAQRGVVRLFNAVRISQVQGQRAREEARKQGVVGMAQREERVSDMSKKGFLDLIAQGGKKAPSVNV